MEEEAIWQWKTTQYEMKEPNRIAIPIEQDIVNIHTAFVLKMTERKNVFETIKQVFKKNKLKF